ncbi:MAG: hypothetical protein FJ368_07405, partial [Pelagibacterales bacterium]|nr:hypothetical protein [Pelagibacterales bacterium]
MEIISYNEIDQSSHGTSCKVFCIHAKVSKIYECAQEMITSISNKSWIDKMDIVPQASYRARAEPTIEKLVNGILKKITNEVTADFGEYMISHSAQLALEEKSHIKFPLSELLKGRISGNEGFDFHTESTSQHIIFGEAKYCNNTTPRAAALGQIIKFIGEKKDDADLDILRNFATQDACKKAALGKKGYVAAFSLNAKNRQTIFK